MADSDTTTPANGFRRLGGSLDEELRLQFKLRGATCWGTQVFFDQPWYNPPRPHESKLFIFFFREEPMDTDNAQLFKKVPVEIGHYCVPLRTITVFDECRRWHESFLKHVQLRSIEQEIPVNVLNWHV